jgi:glucose-6-phosphate 1-dehydrogenase
MTTLESDAFVFFGATGDLAYKKIFPALYAMARRDGLDVPIIGMARAGWGPRASAEVVNDGDTWHDPVTERSSPC